MSPAGEVVVVPFHSKGHTFPATELSLHLATRGVAVTLFLPSLPSSPLHPNINVVLFSGPPPPPPPTPAANVTSSTYPFLPPPPHLHQDPSLEDYLTKRAEGGGKGSSPSFSPPLLCAVVDVMMSHCIETCSRHGVPVVSFFTSSGCAAAMEHAASKLSPEHLGPAGTVVVPGLPEDMALTASDLFPEPPPPPPGGPQTSSGASIDVPRQPYEPSHPGSGCPPPPPFGRGHPGSLPPPFPWGHCGGPPLHIAAGHGGGPPPPPRLGHHHPGGLLRPFHPPSPPPPRRPSTGTLRPPTPPTTHPPSPPLEPFEPGTNDDITAAPARGPGVGGGGGPPRGLGDTGAAAALLFNTCDELELPFLDYLAKEAGKPVWGVGPLLPARFWSTAADGPVSDEAARRDGQETTVAEADVRAWLDSKPPASVIYISFGTLVGPSAEELAELSAALEESDRPFIWVLQADAMNAGSYFPDSLARRAGESRRGLVIRGWAPQLAILSHPSTAAFLSHCGWNSTVEALAKGVPLLAWPVKGDQLCNARLVADRLRVGHPVRAAGTGPNGRVKKEDVARGIERLVADEGVRARAGAVRSIFESGFPRSSAASVDAFVDFVTQRFKEAPS